MKKICILFFIATSLFGVDCYYTAVNAGIGTGEITSTLQQKIQETGDKIDDLNDEVEKRKDLQEKIAILRTQIEMLKEKEYITLTKIIHNIEVAKNLESLKVDAIELSPNK